MLKVCNNSMKRYVKTRPKASSESVRRAKELRSSLPSLQVHPVFREFSLSLFNETIVCKSS